MYRRRRTTGIDVALVEASVAVKSPDLEALICTTEGPAAWRQGLVEEAARLADVVRARWNAIGRNAEVQLYDFLHRVRMSDGKEAPDVSEMIQQALSHPIAGFEIQMVGLPAALDPVAVGEIPGEEIA